MGIMAFEFRYAESVEFTLDFKDLKQKQNVKSMINKSLVDFMLK